MWVGTHDFVVEMCQLPLSDPPAILLLLLSLVLTVLVEEEHAGEGEDDQRPHEGRAGQIPRHLRLSSSDDDLATSRGRLRQGSLSNVSPTRAVQLNRHFGP